MADKLIPKPKAAPTLGPTQLALAPTKITVPSPNDPEVVAASREKARDDQKRRQGRSSTDLAGGPVYSRTKLG
ncbi:MAG: hypothetical protein AAGD43_18035 [Pseudomonadota bacterium]